MSVKLKLIHSFFLLLLITACASNLYNPFRIDQEDFFRKTHGIALAPVEFQISLQGGGKEDEAQFNSRLEEIRKKFESVMTTKLTEAGFSVIPSDEYSKIWDQLAKEQGGFFDPTTGKKDDAKYEATLKKAVQKISAKFPINAVLYPSMVVLKIPFSSGVAKWDGTEQNINGSLARVRGASGFFKTFFSGNANTYGNLTGISLGVRIMDVQTESETFYHRGGIQLLMKQAGFGSMNLVPIPTEELFSSEERNNGAVAYVLDPLFRKQSKGGASQGY